MKRKIKAGLTSVSLPVFIADTSSTTGGGLSGVTSASSGLIMEYRRAGESTWTNLTPQSGKTLGSYLTRGIVADGSLAGAYEVDFPDAAFAAGARFVACRIRGVANMLPVLIEIELDAVDYQDAAAFGLSRIDATIGSRATQTSVDAIDDFVDTEVAAIKAKTDLIVAFPANFGNLDITVGGAIAELGVNALTANGAVDAIPTAVFSALTTATWPTNSFGKQILIGASTQRTVAVTGSHHVAAVLHDAEPNSIPEDAFVDGALSARVIATDAIDSDAMAASANTEIANAVAATQALSRLDSMIESDGAGQFRFDTIALEMAPAGGGGGGTDWTASERTAIRAILGVPTSGTTPTDPSSGILDEIRDSIGNQTINVYPVSASTPERVAGTTLTFYRDESRSVSVVTDFTLTNLTLQFTVEDQDGNDVYALNNASINRSGQTFTVPVTTAVTGGNGQYRWSMRDVTGGGNSVIAMGVLTVQEAASNG